MRREDESHRLHHGVWGRGPYIDHLELTFVAAKLPPSHVFTEVALMAAEENADYF
jgi:hypothetical protein